jgi:pSer/pThr/pTyr-binding forkhead associated (FHA) protein
VNILGIETPINDKYIILEALNSEEVLRKNTKMVHIIDFKKLKKLNVGRGHDNHVRITDISISRLHCKLICMKKEIYLDDQGSKFGSLIAEQKPVNLSKMSADFLIQVGRTLLISNVWDPKF